MSSIDSPTSDDVASVPWQQVIVDANAPDCFDYCNAFCRSASRAEEEGDDRARNVYAFFARVTSLHFKLDELSAPLGPEDSLLSFTDAELALLSNLVTDIADPEMRARVADILFVPAGREGIFARGLYAGLTGDFLVASHLLVPQLEHAVRVLLESRGAIVSGIEDDGSQPERGLNTTLVRPEALEFFGEELIFDLRGLLVEKAGSNLRHDIAHGLLDGAAFQTTEAMYVWWITLRICVLAAGALAAHDATENTSTSDA